jgi:cell division septation protein DedD
MIDLRNKQTGATLLGFIAGLVLGLGVAVGVAVYITRVPAPLVNKVKPPTEMVNPAANGDLPDPNKPLYGTPRADPGTATANAAPGATPTSDPARATALPPAPGLMPASASTIATRPADSTPIDTMRYLLQAGAYHSADDADAVRARLAMLGLDAKVVPRDQDGATLYRVRLGPYGRIEDLDKIRQMLATNGIDVQVVTIK